MLVNFAICGTQKGGTTALDAYLREHPQICMANKKEVHFFDNDGLFVNSPPDYGQYHANFTPNDPYKLVGEATPIYMYWDDAPKRIWQYNPDMKLIILLRNPIERAFSHWNMEHTRQKEHLPFWEAITNEKARCRQALPSQHRVYTYIDRGYYLEQLRRLWRFFPKRNVLILKNEYLKNQPQDALKEICDFLAIDNFVNVTPRQTHSTPYPSALSAQERAYLLAVFEHEIKGLERMLGWDCNDWLTT